MAPPHLGDSAVPPCSSRCNVQQDRYIFIPRTAAPRRRCSSAASLAAASTSNKSFERSRSPAAASAAASRGRCYSRGGSSTSCKRNSYHPQPSSCAAATAAPSHHAVTTTELPSHSPSIGSASRDSRGVDGKHSTESADGAGSTRGEDFRVFCSHPNRRFGARSFGPVFAGVFVSFFDT